jgi:hypothetical protein
MDIKPALAVLLPRAVQWAQEQEQMILDSGRKLARDEIAIARQVGVSQPEKIRLKSVSRVPVPRDFLLSQAAIAIGMDCENLSALTLFYGIFVREEEYNRKLLAHECRHVYQFEQHGSTLNFLREYLSDVLTVGYENSAFEKEAANVAEKYRSARLNS